MNLTQAGLSTSFALDQVNRQLSNGATSGVSYDPLSKTRVSAHETDKQAEDNATWYFEYRALLNSKLTTLITSLTSAYTTDMDAAMGSQDNGVLWGAKAAMQGITGVKLVATDPAQIDPGAARTTYAYLSGFTADATGASALTMTPVGALDWKGDFVTSSDQSASSKAVFNNTLGVTKGSITGTTTFMSGGASDFVVDQLRINMDPFTQPPASLSAAINYADTFATYKINKFDNNKSNKLSSYDRQTSTTNDYAQNYRGIGNNFEYSLYKFFERPENLDLIRFGLFKDVYVVGTSSLPTGSQTQGSLSLDWDAVNQKVVIKQERYACFFHS
ncbi:MAG: hypothetical protein AABZ74_04240 [Cyanobacteriota bacterium]